MGRAPASAGSAPGRGRTDYASAPGTGRGCGRLFPDDSGRRRWCSLGTCGDETSSS
ncbi:CGNR zinc finger domain-containing protein [Streptomyces sp. NPDC048389]|uniref:CGNR zinc finger domain-containing protein n=1 Tax=Streptomyces sp. NPDC048389 TaxID=3154622 RepID=UPI00345206BE